MNVPTRADLSTCVYCPKLCRHVCPVAVGTAREAAVPSNMALQPFLMMSGHASNDQAVAAASLCIDCGACTAHCDLDQPLGSMLTAFRQALTPPPKAQPLPELDRSVQWVAIESDDRRWAEALQALVGEPVARLVTQDHLGHAAITHPMADGQHRAALKTLLYGYDVVVSDHRSLQAARAAGVQVKHLAELVDMDGEGPVHHPCEGPRLAGETAAEALACCGARGSLPAPLGQELADAQAQRLTGVYADGEASPAPLRSPDSSCACTLRLAGIDVRDPVAVLLDRPA